MNLMVPMHHHDLRGETKLNIKNANTVDLIEFLFSSLFVFACISETRADNLTIS